MAESQSMSSKIFFNKTQLSTTGQFSKANLNIRAFHRNLPGYDPTPLLSLPTIAKELGVAQILLKDESYRLGLPAFKVLGASWATVQAVAKKLGLPASTFLDLSSGANPLADLSAAAVKSKLTLYAATDGNHGRAVARMGKYLGIDVRIHVPHSLDDDAKSYIEEEGAKVVVEVGKDYDHTVIATKMAAERHSDGNGVLVSDTALELGDETAQWMVDGYQTMFDELEEQVYLANVPRITHVISPVGVGSLCQATVIHFQRSYAQDPPKVLSVEPEAAACLKASLEAGKSTAVQSSFTICTGMCCGTLSASAWPVLKDGVSIAIAVDDVAVDQAVLELLRYDIHAGPCGAATLAGLRSLINEGAGDGLGRDSVIVLLCTEGTRKYRTKQ